MCSGPPTSAAPKPNMPRTPSSQRQCQSPQAESPPSAEDEPHPEEALAHATGIHLAALRQFATLRYDPTQIPMREAVMECLGLASEGDDELTLASLQGDPTADQRGRGGGRGPSTYWIRRWKMRSEASKRGFERAYLQLLQDVVLPHIGDPRGICYQRDPTFRCHVPGGGPPNGRPHCDASYGHSRAELNFWLPLTAVWGSNSLYSESAPGRADFAPFELHHGQIARFWGNQCHHYTTPNHTGSCRVSLDFRVVPRSCFLERYPGGMRDDGSLAFSIGGFFGWMGPDGVQVCSRRLQSAYPPSHVSPAGLRGDCDGGGDESDVEGSAWAHVWDEA